MPSISFLFILLFFSGNAAFQSSAQDLIEARKMYRTGEYESAIEIAGEGRQQSFRSEDHWGLVKARAELAIGRYSDAAATVEEGLQKHANSIQLRWLGIQASRFTNNEKRARRYLDEIGNLWSENSWLYRDSSNHLIVGRYYLEKGFDAKQVLQKVYTPAREANPGNPEVYLAIGELALAKHDYGLAAKNFSKSIELDPTNPDAHYLLSEALQKSDSEGTAAALNQALEINPNHVPSLLSQLDNLVDREEYEAAESVVARILKVNPYEPSAWSYRAVLAHLDNDPTNEGKYRGRALQHWPANPHVDHLIGKKLSQKYRFQESEAYQRRALVYDPEYLPAKMQLAHDLLRLGQELEGWKLADEVFDADEYNVVAHNLVTLRDHISDFQIIEQDGFVVRMSKHEAAVYGNYVLDLLKEAKTVLAERYHVQLETPIFVEIFPEQQDFAIRTFGLPGGAGFLGVCFGRLVTMNSPAAQGPSLTSWESVLWHEFCHVVTLQKTKNRMPRWLSEGISVYEERQRNPGWGQSMTPDFRRMILGEDLTPVSKLSGAFLSPKSAQHLNFAYYESSLVVEYLFQNYGQDAMEKILNDLALGIPINDTLRRHTDPLPKLDKDFADYARQKAREWCAEINWSEKQPEGEDADSDRWFVGLLTVAANQTRELDHRAAIKTLNLVVESFGDDRGLPEPYKLLAANHRALGETDKELAALIEWADLDADSTQACLRILEIAADRGGLEIDEGICLAFDVHQPTAQIATPLPGAGSRKPGRGPTGHSGVDGTQQSGPDRCGRHPFSTGFGPVPLG